MFDVKGAKETPRAKVLWLIDSLRGGYRRRVLHDISVKMRSEGAGPSCDLEKLLAHAAATVPFYRERFPEKVLDRFPVVTKDTVRSQHEAFLSDAVSPDQRFRSVTSGSTGTPFVSFQDQPKRVRNGCDVIYFAGLAGYALGSQLIYAKIWPPETRKNWWVFKAQNMVPIDVLNVRSDDVRRIHSSVHATRSPSSFLGYVSALEAVARISRDLGLIWEAGKVASVITISESLGDSQRRLIADTFGRRPIMRYSNLENGILAQEDGSGGLLVNTASYHIELLGLDDDRSVPPGQVGRVVVTDKFNRAMPFIRYDTGDLAVGAELCPHRGYLRLTSVEGRRLDQIRNTREELVSSYLVYRNMWKYPDILQYQLAQTGVRSYSLRLNAPIDSTRDELLKKDFIGYLGANADVDIEYVDEIPVLASGKRKMIVNEFQPV